MSENPLLKLVAQAQLAARTKEAYAAAVERFIAYAGEHPSQWTPEAVLSWRGSLSRQMLSRSVNVYLAGVRYASKAWAKMQRDMKHDFASPVDMLRVDAPDPTEVQGVRALTQREIAALVKSCSHAEPHDLRDLAMITLGLRTGMRRMSLHALDFPHFLLPDAVVIRIKGRKKWLHLPPVDGDTIEGVSPWLAWLANEGITSGPIFRRLRFKKGKWAIGRKALEATSINFILGKRAKEAGIEDFSPHMMRHTFVTQMQLAGASWMEIIAWTGHERGSAVPASETHKMVTHYTDKRQVGAASKAQLPRMFR